LHDEKDTQEEELNTTSLNEFENKANKKYNNSDLVVEEEVLGNSLVKQPENVNIILEESHDISPFKLPNSPPTMLDV
jgi:hypothetical protein